MIAGALPFLRCTYFQGSAPLTELDIRPGLVEIKNLKYLHYVMGKPGALLQDKVPMAFFPWRLLGWGTEGCSQGLPHRLQRQEQVFLQMKNACHKGRGVRK